MHLLEVAGRGPTGKLQIIQWQRPFSYDHHRELIAQLKPPHKKSEPSLRLLQLLIFRGGLW